MLLVTAVWKGTLYTISGNDFVNYFYGYNFNNGEQKKIK